MRNLRTLTDAPAIMEAAVQGGHVSSRPDGRNRSSMDFAEEMATWHRAAPTRRLHG
ncbi:hypothetical protein ACFYT4_32695 [Streptomyces sp. NPDC004609]|uniref:hypothetical protein n=1 Tax=Streptomyces sp. NPDC004609 TaxID=3364704 RepID=UPI0036A91450